MVASNGPQTSASSLPPTLEPYSIDSVSYEQVQFESNKVLENERIINTVPTKPDSKLTSTANTGGIMLGICCCHSRDQSLSSCASVL